MSLRFLITGGSQGIGAALVEQATAAGHQAVFTGRDQQRLDDVAARTGATAINADITNTDDNARTVELCQETMGGIDVLVNNAGYAYRAEIGEIDLAKMKQMFDVNVFGMVDLTNRVVPLMKAQQSGDIFNIASTSGTKGSRTGTAYGSSKWAVRGLSQCWQIELRPHGIRVISLCPSEVQTNFEGKTGRDNPNKLYGEDIAATVMSAVAMPRSVLWPEVAIFANNPWKED